MADLEDVRGVQPVERAQPDELVVGVGAERPALNRRAHARSKPLDVGQYSGRGGLDGFVQSSLSAFVEDTLSCRLDLGEQERDLLARFDLKFLPEAHLRHGGSGPMLIEERGHAFEARRQRLQPLSERSEVTGEDAEERVADLVHGGGAALPDTMHLRIEEPTAGVVDRQLPLEADALRQSLRVERLEFGQGAMRICDLADQGVPSGVVQPVVGIVDAQIRGVDRVIRDEPPEVCLDDAPEPIVEGPEGGRGFGSR